MTADQREEAERVRQLLDAFGLEGIEIPDAAVQCINLDCLLPAGHDGPCEPHVIVL